MSEIKVNKLTPRTNCGTTTLGDSGDTINIPAGVTISNNGTATGFGATGAVNWDVASIKTVDFTAVSGVGYFVDTATTGAVIVTLPAAPAVGDVVGVADYAQNFKTANCTLNPNSLKIGGVVANSTMSTDGIAVTLVYVDATKGWIVTDSGLASDAPGPKYVAATGGCITTCGNYKMHKFVSPGTFTVTCQGNTAGANMVSYLVVGGGGGGGADGAGGGGAGGMREGKNPFCSYTAFPNACTSGANNGLSLSSNPGVYPVVVGGGGAGAAVPHPSNAGSAGNLSTFSTITSAGGGFGSSSYSLASGSGGSGGGGGRGGSRAGAAGNDPAQTPPQGNPGGPGDSNGGSGGGGGATASGTPGAGPGPGEGGGPGGAGGTTEILASAIAYAGGGAGGATPSPNPAGVGGTGGGGNGAQGGNASTAGGCNTGGGGGGGTGGPASQYDGSNGGSGIVVIRYKYQ